MVTLTQSAKDYLKSVVTNNDDYVTLGLKGGGCSGFQYVWDLKSNLPDTVPIQLFKGPLDSFELQSYFFNEFVLQILIISSQNFSNFFLCFLYWLN